MAEEFVRKEVFDARMDRMEALMEKTLIEIKADNEKLRSEFNTFRAEVRADINEIRGDVRVLAAQIGTLEAHISTLEYWGAILIGAATIAFGLAQYFHSKRETIAAKVREEVNELRKTVLMLVDAGKLAASR
ncbi:MAG: hypothetical protein IJU98_00185 [Synergistaceae bacterium]|nr:hypothetical protein [Synergistaceae bacterium]